MYIYNINKTSNLRHWHAKCLFRLFIRPVGRPGSTSTSRWPATRIKMLITSAPNFYCCIHFRAHFNCLWAWPKLIYVVHIFASNLCRRTCVQYKPTASEATLSAKMMFDSGRKANNRIIHTPSAGWLLYFEYLIKMPDFLLPNRLPAIGSILPSLIKRS